MPKKRTTIEIPMDLAMLLISEPEDFKDPTKYEETQKVAKALLNVLVTAKGGN